MASKPLLPTSQATTSAPPVSNPRGVVRRTTKAAHKLTVLPEQPEPPTQSKITIGEEDGDGDDEDDEEVTASESDADDDDDEEVEVSSFFVVVELCPHVRPVVYA